MENINFKSNNYRPEIDGLRAFAIIAVIINHFNKDFLPSGFLGVDIFFVISGFVITSSIYSRKNQEFSNFIYGFYLRRVKRLFPGLIFFLITTSIIICFFDKSPIGNLRTAIGALFGISNMYLFKRSVDYNAPSSEMNPFTHTWSLGVEEQFYFIFPFIVWFTGFAQKKKGSFKKLFLIILLASLFSFITFIYLNIHNESGAYFLMPSRFWEMGSGCLLFLITKNKIISKLENLSPSLIFLLIILFLFSPLNLFILSSLGTVLLTCLLIIVLKKGTPLYYLFTKPKIVYIGLISYSLYLWHWGILSLSTWTIGVTWWTLPIQLFLIYIISNLSFKFIETPLRKISWKIFKVNEFLNFIILVISSFISLVTLHYPLYGKLYLGNRNFKTTSILDFKGKLTGRNPKNCHLNNGKKDPKVFNSEKTFSSSYLENCLYISSSENKTINFIGDSHTLSILPLAEKLTQDFPINTFTYSRDGCIFPTIGETKNKGCFKDMNSIEAYLTENENFKNKDLIISTSYLNTYFSYEGDNRADFLANNSWRIFFQRNLVDKNLENYILSIENFANKINKKGGSIVIFAPLPQHPMHKEFLCFKDWYRPKWAIDQGCKKTDKAMLLKQRRHIYDSLKTVEKRLANLYIYDAFPILCNDKFCFNKIDEMTFYTDEDHLSYQGVEFIYNDFVKFLNFNKLI